MAWAFSCALLCEAAFLKLLASCSAARSLMAF
jgi:hypothetical protein